jgi:hypothetical protein
LPVGQLICQDAASFILLIAQIPELKIQHLQLGKLFSELFQILFNALVKEEHSISNA